MTDDSHTIDLLRVLGTPDPAVRAREAGLALERCARATVALAEIRRNALIQMHHGGMTRQEIADEIGVTKPRVSQLIGTGWTYTAIPPQRAADAHP
jgi:DNA-directed RNA polymerase specialized sigma24 family protein